MTHALVLGYGDRMAIEHYSFHLKCSACGATGTANPTDSDNGPNFQVRLVPDGFTHSAYSPNPRNQDSSMSAAVKSSSTSPGAG